MAITKVSEAKANPKPDPDPKPDPTPNPHPGLGDQAVARAPQEGAAGREQVVQDQEGPGRSVGLHTHAVGQADQEAV